MKQHTTQTITRMAVSNGAEWLSLDSIATIRAHAVLGGVTTSDVAKNIRKIYGRDEAEAMLSSLFVETALKPDIQSYVQDILHVL